MDGTVVVENNTKVQELYNEIMSLETKRKHFSINNKYAVGIVRKYREVSIYDYDRSPRPLVRIKNAGQTVLLRLGFSVQETVPLLESLHRIIQAVLAPKEETPVKDLPVHYPQLLPPVIPADDLRSRIGLNQDGKIVIHNTTTYKKR